jgi:hypothetical protein
MDPRQRFLFSTLPGLLGQAYNYVRQNPFQATADVAQAVSPGGALQDALAGSEQISRSALRGDIGGMVGGAGTMGAGLLGAIPIAGMIGRAGGTVARGVSEVAPAARAVTSDVAAVRGATPTPTVGGGLLNEAVSPQAASSMAREVAAAPEGIRAYHGTQHKFDKFDLSKVGTGEGAQAQGHGLYFAEYEPIAKFYRESTAGGPITTNFSLGAEVPLIRREKVIDYTPTRYDSESIAKSTLQENLLLLEPSLRDLPDNASRMEAIKGTLQRMISDEGYPKEAYNYWNRILNGLEQGRTPLRYSIDQPGHIYEVNLRANPERLLDWDVPLNMQPAPVREALRSKFGKEYEKLEGMTNYYPSGGAMRGEDFYNNFLAGSQQAPLATQQLLEAGVPGVRYLDARSRAAGEGSRNYVMFDDNLIDILRRYGLLGTVGAGAAMAGAQEMQQ